MSARIRGLAILAAMSIVLGALWVAPSAVGAPPGDVEYFLLPEEDPQPFPVGITVGPDGALWFTTWATHDIVRMDTIGWLTYYDLPTISPGPAGITVGADHNIWFTEQFAAKVGRISVSGVITEYALPDVLYGANRIVSGPDGNLWVTRGGGMMQMSPGRIAKVSTAGLITEFPLPAGSPHGITVGPDGRLWFITPDTKTVHAMNTDGVIEASFAVPTAGQLSRGITTASDGRIWFTSKEANNFYVNATTVDGDFQRYLLGAEVGFGELTDIAPGPDGNLWVTSYIPAGMYRVTPSGAVSRFSIGDDTYPWNLVAGPDKAMWFTEWNKSAIGRVSTGVDEPAPAPIVNTVSPSSGPVTGGTAVRITGAGISAEATVTFAGKACTGVRVDSAQELSCTVPQGAGPGAVSIAIRNPNGQTGVLADGFTYAQPTPTPTPSPTTPLRVSMAKKVVRLRKPKRRLEVRFTASIESTLQARLTGRTSYSRQIRAIQGRNVLSWRLPKGIKPGLYVLSLISDGQTTASRRVRILKART